MQTEKMQLPSGLTFNQLKLERSYKQPITFDRFIKAVKIPHHSHNFAIRTTLVKIRG